VNERHRVTGRVLGTVGAVGIAGLAILLVGGSQVGVWLVFLGVPLGLVIAGALFVRRTILDYRTAADRFAQRRAIHAGEDAQELREILEELRESHTDWESDEHLEAISTLETEIEEAGIDVEPDARTVTLSASIERDDTDEIEQLHGRIDEVERSIASSFAEYSEPEFDSLDSAIYQLVSAELVDERPETIPPSPEGKSLDLQDCRELSSALHERRTFLDDALDRAIEELHDRADDPDAPADFEDAIETATSHRETGEYTDAVEELTTVVGHVDDPVIETDAVTDDETESDEEVEPVAAPPADPDGSGPSTEPPAEQGDEETQGIGDDSAIVAAPPAPSDDDGQERSTDESDSPTADSGAEPQDPAEQGEVHGSDDDAATGEESETGDDQAAAPEVADESAESESVTDSASSETGRPRSGRTDDTRILPLGSRSFADDAPPDHQGDGVGTEEPVEPGQEARTVADSGEEDDDTGERTDERQIQDDRAHSGDTVDEDDADSPSEEESGFVPTWHVDSDDDEEDSDEPLTRGGGGHTTDGDGSATTSSGEDGDGSGGGDVEETESDHAESTDGGMISASGFEPAIPRETEDEDPLTRGQAAVEDAPVEDAPVEDVAADSDGGTAADRDENQTVPDDARFDDEPVKEVIEEPIRDEATEEYTDHDVIADPWGDPSSDSETDIATERFKGGVVDETLDDIASADAESNSGADDTSTSTDGQDDDADGPLFGNGEDDPNGTADASIASDEELFTDEPDDTTAE
jgi:hypothetical protein